MITSKDFDVDEYLEAHKDEMTEEVVNNLKNLMGCVEQITYLVKDLDPLMFMSVMCTVLDTYEAFNRNKYVGGPVKSVELAEYINKMVHNVNNELGGL